MELQRDSINHNNSQSKELKPSEKVITTACYNNKINRRSENYATQHLFLPQSNSPQLY